MILLEKLDKVQSIIPMVFSLWAFLIFKVIAQFLVIKIIYKNSIFIRNFKLFKFILKFAIKFHLQ